MADNMVDKLYTTKDIFDNAGFEGEEYEPVDPDENLNEYSAVVKGPEGTLYGTNDTVQTEAVATLNEHGFEVFVPGEKGSLSAAYRATPDQIEEEVAKAGGDKAVHSSGRVQSRDDSFNGEVLDQRSPEERAMDGFVERALSQD